MSRPSVHDDPLERVVPPTSIQDRLRLRSVSCPRTLETKDQQRAAGSSVHTSVTGVIAHPIVSSQPVPELQGSRRTFNPERWDLGATKGSSPVRRFDSKWVISVPKCLLVQI